MGLPGLVINDNDNYFNNKTILVIGVN